ncbi:MAG: EAL domain-containing protein [Methylophilales bacterium]|nr:EAL domain-containing protein [Methylophilales bacterium]
MSALNIEKLKASLHEALFLDLDDFGLEIHSEEVVSKFAGLQLRSVFQPISNHAQGGKALGYEALLRPSIGNTDALTPQAAFSFADQQGRLVKFDRVARTLHTLNYLNLPHDKGLLFLNVHPKLLTSVNAHGKVFENILHNHSVPTSQVVIEVLESEVEGDKQLSEAVTNYRDRGYQIAIDDFGSKHSNLDRLWEVSPDFIKLDISIIRQAQTNKKVRKILPKLIEIIHELDAQAIVEGIENEIQLNIAIDSGAKLLQGFLIGKPAPASVWRKFDSALQLKNVA